jgi:predicted metal-dependent hydrolase
MRLQRTRWGSCSAQRTVSLNAALLLLEPELVRYLMVHELCHLRWLDHSRRYWRLVERFEPDFRALDRRLTEAWRELPAWLFAGRRGSGFSRDSSNNRG